MQIIGTRYFDRKDVYFQQLGVKNPHNSPVNTSSFRMKLVYFDVDTSAIVPSNNKKAARFQTALRTYTAIGALIAG